MADEKDQKQETADPVRPVSKDEMKIAFAGPAPLANRFFISITPAGARIAFAEQHGDAEPVFRSAALLDFSDAYALVDVLKALLDRNVKIHVTPKAAEGEKRTDEAQPQERPDGA